MRVIQIIPAFTVGGAEIMCENLTYELIKMGCDVTVISLFSIESDITSRLKKNNVKCIFLNKKKGYDLSQIIKLFKIFKKLKPDVIHMHLSCTGFAMPAAVLSGVKKRVYTVHNVAYHDGSGMFGRLVNSFFIKFFHMIPVALTDDVKLTVQDVYKLNEKDVPVVFNGIDLDKCIIKNKYEINAKDGRFVFLHIGRFVEAKNHRGLLDAFKIVKEDFPNMDIYLRLIGAGDLFESIKKYANELGIENFIEFVGIKDNCYKDLFNADAFVLPSFWEGMPMTLIEAMGTGLPIICSSVGGVPNMITDGVSALMVSTDTRELISAMEKILINEKLRENLGKNALKKSKEYSAKIMALNYYEIYVKKA